MFQGVACPICLDAFKSHRMYFGSRKNPEIFCKMRQDFVVIDGGGAAGLEFVVLSALLFQRLEDRVGIGKGVSGGGSF